MTRFAKDVRGLRFGLNSTLSDDDFVATVMARCLAAPDAVEKREPSRYWGWSGAAMAAAACVAIGVTAWPPKKPPDARPEGGTIAARGNGNLGLAATVQAFVGHAAPGTAPPLLEGSVLHPGDGILVRYSNPTVEDVYLMVFALDERRAVHWIHPAYLDEATNPLSLRLARGVTERVLPEVAEPENPAPGALHVYALLSAGPLDVKSVEIKLAGTQQSVSELFPEAEVEEWRCSWRAQ
jgi:hypothetical protein